MEGVDPNFRKWVVTVIALFNYSTKLHVIFGYMYR